MRTIVFLGQKGGSGKTTLAVNLAAAAHLAGKRVLLLDTDPQRSALQWATARRIYEIDKKNDLAQPLQAEFVLTSQIEKSIKSAQDRGFEYCFIDTAPHLTPGSTRVAEFSDIALVPCRPTALDIGTMKSTTDILRAAKIKELVVLSSCNYRASETQEASNSLSEYGLAVSPICLSARVAYSRSIASGRSVLDFHGQKKAVTAVDEILLLWNIVVEKLGEKTKKTTRN